MEKAEPKKHLLPQFLLLTAVEEGGIRNGVVEVGAQEVRSHSFRRLVGHLDSILEDADWKLLRRVTGQPQPDGAKSRNKPGCFPCANTKQSYVGSKL